MHPPILAFYSNGRQAGKDTAARFVQEWANEHSITTKRVAFADAGKELAAKALGVEGEGESLIDQMDTFKLGGGVGVEMTEGLGHHVEGRDFLINLMEGVRELFGQDTFIRKVLPPSEPGYKYALGADLILVTDLRFMPEVNIVGIKGGKIVEIVNPRAEAPDGRSEGEVTDAFIDYTIDNSGDLEAFKIAMYAFMDSL